MVATASRRSTEHGEPIVVFHTLLYLLSGVDAFACANIPPSLSFSTTPYLLYPSCLPGAIVSIVQPLPPSTIKYPSDRGVDTCESELWVPGSKFRRELNAHSNSRDHDVFLRQ